MRALQRELIDFFIGEGEVKEDVMDEFPLEKREVERIEKEKEEEEKEKERRKERESEDREKQRQHELEDREKQRQHEMAMLLKNREFRSDFVASGEIKLVPRFNEHEVDGYFHHFEKVALSLKWPKPQWSLMLRPQGTSKPSDQSSTDVKKKWKK